MNGYMNNSSGNNLFDPERARVQNNSQANSSKSNPFSNSNSQNPLTSSFAQPNNRIRTRDEISNSQSKSKLNLYEEEKVNVSMSQKSNTTSASSQLNKPTVSANGFLKPNRASNLIPNTGPYAQTQNKVLT